MAGRRLGVVDRDSGRGVLAGSVSKPFVHTFSVPGIPSLQAQTMQQELFSGTPDAQDLATANVVVAAPEARRREDFVHGMSAREAVVDGASNSARVATAAATIMISVFSARRSLTPHPAPPRGHLHHIFRAETARSAS